MAPKYESPPHAKRHTRNLKRRKGLDAVMTSLTARRLLRTRRRLLRFQGTEPQPRPRKHRAGGCQHSVPSPHEQHSLVQMQERDLREVLAHDDEGRVKQLEVPVVTSVTYIACD